MVSWVITCLRDLQPTFIGVIIHLLSTMDIPVSGNFLHTNHHVIGQVGQSVVVRLTNSIFDVSTLPETNSSPRKMDGWNTILSYWVSPYFQGRLLLVSGRVIHLEDHGVFKLDLHLFFYFLLVPRFHDSKAALWQGPNTKRLPNTETPKL